MINAVRVWALVALGAVLLTGAVLASDTPPTPPAPPSPPADDAAPPPPAPPPPPATEATEKDPLDEVVCKKEETTVGSRLGARKVCKTRRQWRDEKRDTTLDNGPGTTLQPGPGATP